MKIIYLATDDIAVNTLLSIVKYHDIAAVVTQPDRAKGRSKRLMQSPIAEAAVKNKIKVYKPEVINNDLIEELKRYKADIFITFSYGVILKKDFLNITRSGGLNIHPSLLPDLRGPSPIKTAILKGYKKSGITIQDVKLKVDSGNILKQVSFNIDPEDNGLSVKDKVSVLSADIIIPFLKDFNYGRVKGSAQDESKATYCKLIKKEDGKIDWGDKGNNIINKIRAFVEWPITHSFIDGIRINIFKARLNKVSNFNDYSNIKNGKIIFADKINGIVVKCSDKLINIEILQQMQKKVLNWKDFINGYRDLKNKQFDLEN